MKEKLVAISFVEKGKLKGQEIKRRGMRLLVGFGFIPELPQCTYLNQIIESGVHFTQTYIFR